MQQYQPLGLISQLKQLRERQYTGLVGVETKSGLSDSAFFISFLSGEINYVGCQEPMVSTIFDQLIESLKHSFLPMALKVARERSETPDSPRAILLRIVSLRIVTWPQIEEAMQAQASSILRDIAKAPGVINLIPNAGTDLCFGEDGHCLDWSYLQQCLTDASTSGSSSSRQPSLSQLQSELASSSAQRPQPSTVSPSSEVTKAAAQNRDVASLPTILSVDDSPIVQKMIERTLGPVCNVLLAQDALTALKILNQDNDIALILLDVNMPGVSGLEFCRTIRKIPKFQDLPVIMLTANEGRVSKAMGQIAGSTLYLNKPVDDQKLLSVVRQYTNSAAVETGKDTPLPAA